MADNLHNFQWNGIDQGGKRVAGTIKVADSRDLANELKKRGVELISFKEKKTLGFSFQFKKKVKNKDILLFTRYLSTMLASGLPILQALDIIARDQENEKMREFVVSLRSNIAGGKTLGETFTQYPQYFNPLYASLIKTGEKSGTLDKILKRLAIYLEKTEALKRKIKKAMIYPIAILVVAFVVTLILLLFVVPQFEKIFSTFGAKLPIFTLMVVHLSSFLRTYWWIVLAGLIAGVVGLRRSIRSSEKMRERVDRLSFKIPIIGKVLQKAIIARFTRTLAITLEAGMPIVDAMNSMVDIMGSSIYSKGVVQIRNDVMNGIQLNVAMSNTKLFPNMAVQMILVGETSGSLAEMLNRVADYYEDEVNSVVDNLSSLIEPLIMAVLGVIIGGFVVAMYLPIFKIGSLF